MVKKNFSFYEQVGIIIPGAILLFGMIFYVPELKTILTKDGFSVGSLGIFVLVSYAAGHAVAALGNVVEAVHWKARGGMPSNWIIGSSPRLLSRSQIDKLQLRLKERFGLTVTPLHEIEAKEWFPISRQIYSEVERYGKKERIDAFNGNYGLNRGLSAALVVLAAVNALIAPAQWCVTTGLLSLSAVYLYRMDRFGRHYARELYSQFLTLRSELPKPKKPRPEKSAATTPQ